jgi:peptide/nickel transport system ATP-binding protein
MDLNVFSGLGISRMKTYENSNPESLLRINDLSIAYKVRNKSLKVLHDISLEVWRGQALGIVGESGSGKTTLALGILGYLPESGTVCQGSISFAGQNILKLNDREKQEIWGSQIAFVPQDASSSFNPTLTVGEQMVEGLLHHLQISKVDARPRVLELLQLVRIPNPEVAYQSYPHQLSGGMQQRVLIGIALSLDPQLLILDEPTTNLDMTTQAAILDLVQELVQQQDTTVLYVTHNLGVVSQICDRVAVLYAGELVEVGATDEVLQTPNHPYTYGLLDSLPNSKLDKQNNPLRAIQGRIPLLSERPKGCIFLPRCPIAAEICQEHPPLYAGTGTRRTRCHRWEEISDREVVPTQPKSEFPALDQRLEDIEPVLEIDSVKVQFPSPRSIMDRLKGKTISPIRALDGINLNLSKGQTLGIVGESGSGKTTLARTVLGLVEKDEGQIDFLSFPLPALLKDRDQSTLQNIQMIFQNPEESFNQFTTIGDALQRPLQRLLGKEEGEARRISRELLTMVHLPETFLRRFPLQLSGGEIQRAAIARAFATNPKLLVSDEPVSALDVSVQASILNLLFQLQMEHSTATLLISHNIPAVAYLADIVAVMYLGRLMEITDAHDLFTPPLHPYTEVLNSAIPAIDSKSEQSIRLEGDLPSPAEIPSGCPFFSRCPRSLGEICQSEEPPWQELPSGKRIYCHIPANDLHQLQDNLGLEHPSDERVPQ